jgi:hypothetical protein
LRANTDTGLGAAPVAQADSAWWAEETGDPLIAVVEVRAAAAGAGHELRLRLAGLPVLPIVIAGAAAAGATPVRVLDSLAARCRVVRGRLFDTGHAEDGNEPTD